MNNSNMPVIIDIEASGFGKSTYPIEVGLAMEDGSTECFLIKPEPDWIYWDNEAEKLHGISRDTLIKHGCSVDEVCHKLNQALSGKTVYSDAWSYDQSWLYQLFDSANQPLRFRIQALTYLMNEKQMEIWSEEKDKVQKQLEIKRHRASNDALILQKTYTVVHQQSL